MSDRGDTDRIGAHWGGYGGGGGMRMLLRGALCKQAVDLEAVPG
jgi:hypothetical protein